MITGQEICIRRDNGTNITAFLGKSVSIWGCGAIGANVAIHLARAGVAKLVLHDHKNVTPGILVRQPFRYDQCGENKAESLKKILEDIRKDMQVKVITSDINEMLKSDNDICAEIDVIIDCTASNKIHLLSEIYFSKHSKTIPIISLSFDSAVRAGLVICIGKNYPGALYSVSRSVIIEFCRNKETEKLIEPFLISNFTPSLEPIPGCSEPTFIGSSVDVALYASALINTGAQWINSESFEIFLLCFIKPWDNSSGQPRTANKSRKNLQ